MIRNFLTSILLALLLAGTSSACRTANPGSQSQSKAELPPVSNKGLQMGVSDVSFYLTAWQGLKLSTPTLDSVLFPEPMFQETLKLAADDKASASERAAFEKYDDWTIAAVRIDSCAKILPQDSCRTQMRLVAQPADKTGIFRDQAIHLAYNVDDDKSLEMLQDFVELKKKKLADPRSADPLPLIIKYARVSKLERVAIMLTMTNVWVFAASQTVHDAEILATPIPCIGAGKVSFLASEVVLARNGSAKIDPESKCQDLNAQRLLTEDLSHGTWQKLSQAEKDKEIQTALRINDPSKVFFGSTDCVSCHVAGRALLRVKGPSFLNDVPNDPNRYVRPSDMQGEGNVSSNDHFNAWGTRAFGYGQDGKSKAMSLYSFNDSLRVAHEINELIRAGKLK